MLQLKKRARWTVLFAALVSLIALAAVACGDDDDNGGSATNTPGSGATATPTTEPGMDYGSLSGNIDIDGSSTVFPIAAAMAEDFASVSPVRVNVALSGTGGGFEKFCRGETQISNASRSIRQAEIDACAANGINDIVEFYVAIDALTVVLNPRNDFATCLDREQLAA
ncbi:MAG TPA: substrate-binding domain-containing protein, partial [Tepidiformaceae bacterium]|nr:substrate-binding domain-containing protein [Tepidiformaceae bacterium]